jgi:hypothetical protein
MNDRNGNPTNVIHTYKVKSTSIASLAVTSPYASFSSKANISEIVNGVEQSIEGNDVMQLNIYDAVAPGYKTGSKDSIALTVYRKAGGVWFSNNWVISNTVLDAVCAGDVSVTGSGGGAVVSTANPRLVELAPTAVANNFDVKVYPNPSQSQFNVKLESSNMQDEISIVIYDLNGKPVETRQHLKAGQTLVLGGLYRPGVYMLEMIQGNQHKQMKLVKIPD